VGRRMLRTRSSGRPRRSRSCPRGWARAALSSSGSWAPARSRPARAQCMRPQRAAASIIRAGCSRCLRTHPKLAITGSCCALRSLSTKRTRMQQTPLAVQGVRSVRGMMPAHLADRGRTSPLAKRSCGFTTRGGTTAPAQLLYLL
jgi:hypothetical protein